MTFEKFLQEYGGDIQLAGLLDEAQEYAQIYLLSKERRKGCDGMSQHAAVTEEFRDAIDRLSSYCRGKNYAGLVFEKCDIDSIASLFLSRGKKAGNGRMRDTR